eukprot:CAMPEP_0180078580 /NCGR_PEP_ID=MMETSP0985-20121206/16393_1 /TAXON_ID=483367 /ORGANISM="non described non described, Strain CCMP 2436" /LENGTH=33 /DNA_ID= /DNA_START= /DNA_END= /DNA_ORIENTATION=
MEVPLLRRKPGRDAIGYMGERHCRRRAGQGQLR